MAAGMAARAHKPGPKPGTKKKCKPEGMEEEEWKVEQRRRKSLQQQARRALTAVTGYAPSVAVWTAITV